jgi:hypothetical protein
METIRTIVQSLLDVTSIWSVILRGLFWVVIAGGIIVSTDTPRPEQGHSKIKQNLGFILLFIVLSGTLVYLLFGFSAAPRS